MFALFRHIVVLVVSNRPPISKPLAFLPYTQKLIGGWLPVLIYTWSHRFGNDRGYNKTCGLPLKYPYSRQEVLDKQHQFLDKQHQFVFAISVTILASSSVEAIMYTRSLIP